MENLIYSSKPGNNSNSYSRVKAYRNYHPVLWTIVVVLGLIFFAVLGFTAVNAAKSPVPKVTEYTQDQIDSMDTAISDRPSNSIQDETPGIEFKWVKVKNIGGRVVSLRRVSTMFVVGDIIVGDDGQKVRIIAE